jgi:hypothetical protein
MKESPKDIDWGQVKIIDKIMEYIMLKYVNANCKEDDSWSDIMLNDIYITRSTKKQMLPKKKRMPKNQRMAKKLNKLPKNLRMAKKLNIAKEPENGKETEQVSKEPESDQG